MYEAVISHHSNTIEEGPMLSSTNSVGNAEVVSPTPWYILRYRTLNSHTKDNLLMAGIELYLPQSCKKHTNTRTGHVECISNPIIPGYVFVHASLDEAKSLGEEFGLNLWKRYYRYTDDLILGDDEVDTSEQRLYHSVSNSQMEHLMRAVEIYKNKLILTDASEIDLQEDDYVEIISGEHEGTRGYLKTSQGKSGGMVIVPVSSKFRREKDVLCYTIQATADEIGVISFAGGKRHASDCIRTARQLVEKVLRQFAAGEPLSEVNRKQLLRYLARFRNTQFRSDKLKANHLMLQYQIYTMLQNYTLREVVLEKIQHEVLPAFDTRIADAQRRGRPDGLSLKEKYLRKIEKADDALSAWEQKRQ